MQEDVDDVKEDVRQLSHDPQIVHKELPVLGLWLITWTLQLVVDEVTERVDRRVFVVFRIKRMINQMINQMEE